jgi:hypothetical protein
VKPAPIALTAPAGLVLLVAAAVGVPLAISSWSGSLGIPHNDAWAYDQVATWFARTGHIHLVGWGSMFLVGQIVVLGPLAKFIVAQHLFVAATAAVALVATYMLLAPRIGRRGALLGSAVIAAWPGFGVLATSFMTDVPAFAAMMLTLALGDAALRRSSLRLLAGALAAGIWAFTIREQAVAALVAVSVAALADRTTRARTAAVVVPFATLCVGLEAWRRGLPNGDAPTLHLMPAAAVGHALASGWFTLALPLLPATVTIATERWRRRSWVAANTAVAVGLFLLTVGFFVGNYLSATVAFADGNAPRLIPGLPYLLVLLAGLISGAVLAGAVVERWRRLDTLLGTFTVLSVAILVVETALGQTLFDRYLIVLAPGCFALCMGDTRKPPRASYAALAGVGALSLVILAGTLAYDGARWRVASQLGIAPAKVDAGFAWAGAHASAPPDRAGEFSHPSEFYLGMFQGIPCYVLSGSPMRPADGGRVVREYRYTWLFGSATLYLTNRCRPGSTTLR